MKLMENLCINDDHACIVQFLLFIHQFSVLQ